MRIAVVSPYDLGERGGVQQQVIGLVAHLRADGEEAWAVGPGCPPDIGSDVGGSVPIPVNRSSSPVALDPRVVYRIRRALDGADVAHIHEPFVPLVGTTALTVRIPQVLTFHADPPGWVRSAYRMGQGVGGLLLGQKVCTAVSEVAASALRPMVEPLIIPNGVDVSSFRGARGRRSRRVSFVGRDDRRKGLDVALAAWREVRHRHPDAELVVAGSERRPRDGVRFLGSIDEEAKRSLLTGSSILIAPNLGGESFGIVVVEGMASGCAVVASDIPAFRAVLGDAGVLVEPGDHRALASALIDLLERPGRREALGEAAQHAAERFDWSSVVTSYRSAYARAISG